MKENVQRGALLLSASGLFHW